VAKPGSFLCALCVKLFDTLGKDQTSHSKTPAFNSSLRFDVKTLLLLLSLGLASVAHAQTTWKGLSFGESRDNVRAALAAQNFDVETSQEGSLQSVNDYQLLLPGMKNALPLRADFRFTSAGGLMDITLSLDLAAMRQSFPNIAGENALLAFASTKLTRALTDKYAAPISRQAGCSADACAINWRDPGQSVELNWLTHAPKLFIRYQMLTPDL
jgi:hypothetical protein